MRAIKLLILLVGLSDLSSGQQSDGVPTTLTGCLTGLNGSFTLQTSDGIRHILIGSRNELLSHNGQLVVVTGTPGTSKRAVALYEFQVSSVKKLADVCQPLASRRGSDSLARLAARISYGPHLPF
jgi:hypothetical protein